MYIKVDVMAGSREESVKKVADDSFEVSVREKPERNLANRRVLELIQREFGGTGLKLKIISGHHSPRKIISVDGLT